MKSFCISRRVTKVKKGHGYHTPADTARAKQREQQADHTGQNNTEQCHSL